MAYPQAAQRPRLVQSVVERVDRARAGQLRQLVLDLELPPRTRADWLASLDRDAETRSEWCFIMLSPHENAAVVAFLVHNAREPKVAVWLWAEVLKYLRLDTGEILRTREELARELGITPRAVSRVMAQLEEVNAIRRQRDGRGVRYFLNPNVGTHVGGAARDRAQREAGPGPLLTLMEGGKPE